MVKIMKRLFLIAAFACGMSATALAQTEFEHTQARRFEGMHEFFVRPMVAEMKMLKEECQEYGPFNIFPGLPLNELTESQLEAAKINATYKAAAIAGADIILGTTYYVTNNKKTKGLDVIVRGFPAKYTNFHNFGDAVKGKEDEKWIVPLQEGARTRELGKDYQKAKVISADARTK
jgi:DhnA family fructose-bisphosphate aldolase class Ia